MDSKNANTSSYVSATASWLEKVVIGLNLCPFARSPFSQGLIRYAVEVSDDPEQLAATLVEEALFLREVAPELVETTLLIHPNALLDFFDYNDFLDQADWLLQQAGLEGIIQIASFHPYYQFAGTRPEDPENYTNRSPFPMLHLLREESLSRALEHYDRPEDIPERNIATMRKLGIEGVRLLLGSARR